MGFAVRRPAKRISHGGAADLFEISGHFEHPRLQRPCVFFMDPQAQ